MCELLGVSSASEMTVNELLEEFFTHCDKNPNGWGLAIWDGLFSAMEKEPVLASKSTYLRERLRTAIKVSTMLAHVRKATIGGMDRVNNHPFAARDSAGRVWTLIHNGTVFDYPPLSPYQYVQEGSTDSERILLYLVDLISRRQTELGRPLGQNERFSVLDDVVRDMAKGNKLNLLVYDGELLYAHTNYAGSLHVNYFGDSAILSTFPLKKGRWEPVRFTSLCAWKDGVQVLEGAPHGHEYIDNEEDMRYIYAPFAGL